MKSINLAVAFLLELAMLAAFVYWGFHTGSSLILKILLGVGVPAAMAVFWGVFMAPKAQRHLTGAAYLAVKAVLFGLASWALAVAGQPLAAIVLAAAFVVNQTWLELLK